jgi:hypothetical protein
MPPVGLEPAVPASERPQIYALDRAATGIVELTVREWLYLVSWKVQLLAIVPSPNAGHYETFWRNNSLLIFSWISFAFTVTVLRYCNFSAFSKDAQKVFISQMCLLYW